MALTDPKGNLVLISQFIFVTLAWIRWIMCISDFSNIRGLFKSVTMH